jgi:hypothetical protein
VYDARGHYSSAEWRGGVRVVRVADRAAAAEETGASVNAAAIAAWQLGHRLTPEQLHDADMQFVMLIAAVLVSVVATSFAIWFATKERH